MIFINKKLFQFDPIKIFTTDYTVVTACEDNMNKQEFFTLNNHNNNLIDIMLRPEQEKAIITPKFCIYLDKELNGILELLGNKSLLPSFITKDIVITYVENNKPPVMEKLFNMGYKRLRMILDNIENYEQIWITYFENNETDYSYYFIFDKYGNETDFIKRICPNIDPPRQYFALMKNEKSIEITSSWEEDNSKIDVFKLIEKVTLDDALIKSDKIHLYINRAMHEVKNSDGVIIKYSYSSPEGIIYDEKFDVEELLKSIETFRFLELYKNEKLIFAYHDTSEDETTIDKTDIEFCEHMLNHYKNKTLIIPNKEGIKIVGPEINTEFVEITKLIIIHPQFQFYKNIVYDIHNNIPDSCLITGYKEDTLYYQEIEIKGKQDLKELILPDNLKLMSEEIIDNKKYCYFRLT